MCQSTTGTAPWLNRLVNKHHTHTGGELGCGAAGGGVVDRRFGPRLLTTPPHRCSVPAAECSARPNLGLCKSVTRLMHPTHPVISSEHIHAYTFCICFSLSLGSTQRKHTMTAVMEKLRASLLSGGPSTPPLRFVFSLCLSPVCLLLQLGPHRCSKPHPSTLAGMNTFAHTECKLTIHQQLKCVCLWPGTNLCLRQRRPLKLKLKLLTKLW